MAPIIGYSSTRVNSIDSTPNKEEFGRWVHMPNFRAIRAAAPAQTTEDKQPNQPSFATLLKQAEQDNNKAGYSVELRPVNRPNRIDIIA